MMVYYALHGLKVAIENAHQMTQLKLYPELRDLLHISSSLYGFADEFYRAREKLYDDKQSFNHVEIFDKLLKKLGGSKDIAGFKLATIEIVFNISVADRTVK